MLLDISETVKNNIKNYNYISNDASFLSKYVYSICYKILEFIPKSVSPNIITLCGLGSVLFSTLLILFFSSSFSVLSLALISAFCLFVYQMCDTLDGRQAKRLGMYTNPTTELFDHGVDSIVVSLSAINSVYLVDINNPVIAVLSFLLTASIFYLPTWEHVFVGTMNFRKGLCNPTESLISVQLGYLTMGLLQMLRGNIYIQATYSCVLFYFFVLALVGSVKNVFYNANNNFKFYDKLIMIAPLVLVWIFGIANSLQYGSYVTVLNTCIVWNFAILALIWSEITKTSYAFAPVIVSFILHLVIGVYALVLTVPFYVYIFSTYTKTMCSILNMTTFWSIPKCESSLPTSELSDQSQQV